MGPSQWKISSIRLCLIELTPLQAIRIGSGILERNRPGWTIFGTVSDRIADVHRQMQMWRVVGISGIAAASDALPLRYTTANADVRSVMRQVCVQGMRAVIVANYYIVVETLACDLTILV